MLYQIGPLTLDSPMGLNPQDAEEEFGGDFAVKGVVGARQRREFVGPADTTLNLSGQIFPFRARAAGGSSGLTELDLLKGMAETGEPQMVIRGDGLVLGYYVIEHGGIRHSNLSGAGVGRVQEFRITLVQSPTGPAASALLATLDLLFS